MLIHSFSKCPAGFSYIVHVTLSDTQVYDIEHLTCFGKSFSLYDLSVKLHFILSSF